MVVVTPTCWECGNCGAIVSADSVACLLCGTVRSYRRHETDLAACEREAMDAAIQHFWKVFNRLKRERGLS